MFRFTISQKLLGLFLINISIFILIVSNTYLYTNKNALSINKIEKNTLPIASLYTRNLYLLKSIRDGFMDCATTNEKEILENTLILEKEILNNFKKLNVNYEVTKHSEVLFNKYFKYGYEFSLEISNREVYKVEEAKILQKLSLEVLEMFEKLERDSNAKVNQALEKLNKETNQFFQNSIFTTFLGLTIMLIAGLYVYSFVRDRFHKIINSVKNLSKEQPDFSLRFVSDNYDEIYL
jgi:hypothetical protein